MNARAWHSLADLEKVAEVIEDEMGYRLVYGCFHRDEGHPNDAGEWIENNHFHLEFISLDENGISQHRKTFSPSLMSKIQTKIANVLNMERGISKEITGRKHLTPRQYKQAVKLQEPIKQELKLAKNELNDAKQKIKGLEAALKAANLEARNELKEQGGRREDYAKLEEENKKLKDELAELKKAPTDMNIDDELAKIGARIEKIKNSKRIKKETEVELSNLKNALGIFDREKVSAFVSESIALSYAVQGQIREYVPILKDIERYKDEASQAKNLKNNKIAQVFFGGVASKPADDVDAIRKENASLLETFDALHKQNKDLRDALTKATDLISQKNARPEKPQKNQEGFGVSANDSFFLGQATMLLELVKAQKLYIEPKGRHLVESLNDIVSGETPFSSFAGIKSGLLSYAPSFTNPKNDLEM